MGLSKGKRILWVIAVIYVVKTKSSCCETCIRIESNVSLSKVISIDQRDFHRVWERENKGGAKMDRGRQSEMDQKRVYEK